METTTESVSIERELVIDASPETVWEFLVDPEKIVRWMGTAATFDARPGGEYRIEVIPGHTAAGEFVELDAPHRLVYTFGWEDGASVIPPGGSTVEIELTPSGSGTAVRFTQSGIPGAESAESHGYGWDHYLARLAVAGAGGDPGVDPWVTGAQ
jgi:uncharacterized protein YndB with AHSA1/START domain